MNKHLENDHKDEKDMVNHHALHLLVHLDLEEDGHHALHEQVQPDHEDDGHHALNVQV